MKRVASIVLVLCLLYSSTPAAAQTTITLAQSSSVSFWFWFHSSGLATLVQGLGNSKTKEQEKQRDRDEKVNRIQIFPTDVTVDPAEHVRFAAVAYDADGNSVGGVKIKWSGESAQHGRRVRISKEGDFEATAPGSFTIVAQAAGKTAKVNVVVRPGLKPDLTAPPTGSRQVSTRDLPGNEVGSNGTTKTQKRTERSIGTRSSVALNAKRSHVFRAANASAPKPMMLSDGWDSGNYWSADDPGNEVGDPPGRAPDEGAGSGNFHFAAPLLSLASRGVNISLSLSYNSRLWNKAGSQISYDNDRGWPAPGFSLGLGKMLGMGVYNGCMLADGDGTRHSYTGTITFYSWGTFGLMHTTDGSFIDYSYWTGTGGIITWAQARLPNGTVINYGANGPGGVFPTSIEDANGNFIYITYVNNSGPRIQTVTDTAGRVISFYYNYNNLLTAITAPGLSGGTRTLVRLHYHQHTLSYGFNGLTASARDYYPWVVDAIYYPGTNTGYWLNDSDSYSSYGMLAKVVEERNLGFSASSLTDMGSVWQGSVTRSQTYNYPLTPNYSLTDAPTYTTMVESWTRDGVNVDSATTGYEVYENATPRMTIITLPNGTKSKRLSFNAPGQWNDGLTYHDETYVTEGQPLQGGNSYWEPGAYGSARPTRVEKIDERGQLTASEFSYGSVYNQVTEVRDYDYGGTSLLRATRTTYQNSSAYTGGCNSYGCYGRHIFNLPLSVEVYASDYVTRVSRTDYQYDGQPLTAAPNVVMHNQAANPHAEAEGFCYWDYDWNDPDCTGSCWDYNCDGYCPQYWICPYDSSTDFRGNVTQITSYADAAGPTGATIETRRYDVTGNRVKVSTSCCEQTTFNYTADTQYAYPQSQTRGSATDQYAQVTTSATYDFGTGLTLSATDSNGHTSTNTYDANSLRTTSGIAPTGAHADYIYDDVTMTVTTTTYLAVGDGGGIADKNIKLFNGRGQVRQQQALGAGSVWDYVDTIYDNMGQVCQQSRPYRNGETPQWTMTTYDALNRAKTVTSPEGSVTQTFYNEASRPSVASSNPGETTRMQDPWGRERWIRTDANGRLAEVVEPDPSGGGSVASNGMVTTYGYNTLGSLTQITQGAQTRSFKYDALKRLIAQKLAEASATLNDAGNYVGSGTWSEVFTYDDRSNLTSRTDARGVKTIYTYNNDPLNRLQSISWDTSGFGDSANPILPAATVTFSYRAKSYGSQLLDVTQLSSLTAAGVSTESYDYDSEGRVSVKTLVLASRASYPFATNYNYDSLDRPTNLLYPAEYGNGTSPRKVVHRDYDIASRLGGLTFDSQTLASNIVYNAASQTTSISVGTGTNQVNESYSYNAQSGSLDNQTFTRNGSTLLNLSYDYAGANGKRTGQLVRISNNLDHNKDRGYEYDALGRLRRSTGGQNVNWVQHYQYDRYGNRWNVFSYNADQYVRNFYQSALNRQPNSTELQNWLSSLQSAYAQGQSQFLTTMQNLGESLFSSQEYANRNRSDHDYVYDLYKSYLFRDPEPSGWAFWEAAVPTNGRPGVRNGFAWSYEFWLKVNGTSPYCPPNGSVPADGFSNFGFDTASNRNISSGYAYDAAGNQVRALTATAGISQRFQYDAANRLIKVKADDNVTVLATYTYGDSSDRLIAEQGGVRNYYVFEGDSTIAEYSDSGGSTAPAWSKSYIYLGPRLLSTLTPNGSGGEAVEYHHPDRLGTRVVTNPSTGGSFEQVALPFGTALNAESTGATNRRFTSYDRSTTTGLDYALNRHYDPQQGRFTQVDPAGMKATVLLNPQSLNLYAYCTNDPVNRADPDGLGLISFFKKAFNWIKKHWKIILVAVAVAVAVLLIPGAPSFLGSFFQNTGQVIISSAGAAAEGGGISTTLKIILGASFAAAIAGLGILSQKVESFEDARLREAKEELLRRLEANKGENPCAKLLGGLKEAKKKLKETKFKRGATTNPDAVAETQGKTVTLNPNNGFYDTSGTQTLTVGLLGSGGRFIPLQITLNNLQFAAFVLLHELGHRTGTLRPDGNDPFGFISIFNSGDVQKACFPEAIPVAVP